MAAQFMRVPKTALFIVRPIFFSISIRPDIFLEGATPFAFRIFQSICLPISLFIEKRLEAVL